MAWGSVGILICMALCILAVQSPETLTRWDQALRIGPDWWRNHAPWLAGPLVWVSNAFGALASTFATAGAAGLLMAKKHVRAAVYVVAVIAGTSLLTNLLKHVVGQPRPVVVDPVLIYTSGAMPSGHASNAAATVIVAGVLSALFGARRATCHRVLAVAVFMALVVGLDRLLLGVHTLTEVVAGYAAGLGVGLIATYAFEPAPRGREVHPQREGRAEGPMTTDAR